MNTYIHKNRDREINCLSPQCYCCHGGHSAFQIQQQGNSTTAILPRDSLQQGNGSGLVKVTTTCFNVAFFIFSPTSITSRGRDSHDLDTFFDLSRVQSCFSSVVICTDMYGICTVYKSDQTHKSCFSSSIKIYLLVRCVIFKRCTEPIVFMNS